MLIQIAVLCIFSFANALPNLRNLTSSIFVGSAANYGDLTSSDTNYHTVLAQQYNLVTPENEMKWPATEPERGQFTYTQGDYIVKYANANGQTIRGHNLCWGVYNPTWLTSGNFNGTELQSILQNHISNVASHYKGQVYSWDVVNEAIADNATSTEWYKHNVWYPAVPNYIDLAFQWTRAADPKVKLFYNDYSAEGAGSTKSDTVYAMVKSMKQRGIPIDGVGLQMHVSLGYSPSPAAVVANIQRLVALGLEVHITEMDVSLQGGTGTEAQNLQAQATIYGNMLKACLQVPGCKSFETWGFTDKYSWLGANNEPLPFDVNYQPKPAFNTLASVLQ